MAKVIDQSQIRHDPASRHTHFPDERPPEQTKQPGPPTEDPSRRTIMANQPRPADTKRDTPPRWENDQAEHEGSAHSPEEFDVMNPERTKGNPNDEVQEQQ